MAKGLVVPDNPAPDEYITVPFRIPNDPQWFGIIAGLLYSPCNGYWWKKDSGDFEAARDTMCQVATEFSMNLTEFCSQVALCIEDSEAVKEIIREMVERDILRETFGDSQQPLGQGLTALDGCPPDVVFGIVTGFVDYVDTQIRDAIEIVEVATNALEVLNIWVGATPVIGDLVTALSDYAAWLQDTIGENYVAQWTTGLRDDFRCALFCLWMDSENCALSLEDIVIYFINRMGASESILNTIGDMINFALTGVWGGDQIVEIMFLSALGMMAVSSGAIPFITIPVVYEFEKVIALASNNPDGDWSILCEDCPQDEWCYTFDFTVNNGGWTVYPLGIFGATYSAGVGWKPTNVTGGGYNHRAASIRVDVPMMADITRMEVIYDYTLGLFNTSTSAFLYGKEPPQVNYRVLTNGNVPAGTNQELAYDDEYSTDQNIYLYFRTSARTSGTPNGDVTIKRVTLYGTGTNPFGSDNCS